MTSFGLSPLPTTMQTIYFPHYLLEFSKIFLLLSFPGVLSAAAWVPSPLKGFGKVKNVKVEITFEVIKSFLLSSSLSDKERDPGEVRGLSKFMQKWAWLLALYTLGVHVLSAWHWLMCGGVFYGC